MDEQAVFRHFVKALAALGCSFWGWCKAESGRLLVAGIVLLLAFLLSYGFCKLVGFILKKRQKSNTFIAVMSVLERPFVALICVSGLDSARYIVHFPASMEHILAKIFETAFVLVIIWGVCNLFSTLAARYLWKIDTLAEGDDGLSIGLIRKFLKCVVIVICVLFIGQNIFNFNISAILAGAGVAGLGIAFAAQNTIANIFGAVTIAVDKPFVIGDRIVIGGRDGVVESLGLRSTTIRSMDGTVHIIPNKEMGDSSVENITRRTSFKQTLSIGLTYDTTPEQMDRAKEILHEILDNNYGFDMANKPPRIYFAEMKDWSLNISVTLWFPTADYQVMMAAKDQILTAILKRFNAEGLSFAYPTSTNYIVKQETHA